MIKPDPRTIKAVANAVRHYPELLEWLEGWQKHELEQLPYAVDHAALKQGRCQVLGELTKFAKNSLELAAKL